MNTKISFPVTDEDMIEFYSKNETEKDILINLLNFRVFPQNIDYDTNPYSFIKELKYRLTQMKYEGEYRYYEILKFLYKVGKLSYETQCKYLIQIQDIHPHMYKGLEFIATSNYKRHRILASSIEKVFKSTIRTFEDFIKTPKWNYIRTRTYNKPYRIYKQFTNEYCGYYILPEYIPDFIEFLTESKNNYITTIHELLDKEYPRESFKYHNCMFGLLIYQIQHKKTAKLIFDIKYQYEFGNDSQTRNVIGNKTYLLFKLGYKSELKDYAKQIINHLHKTILTFKQITKYKEYKIEEHEFKELDITNLLDKHSPN